MSELEGYGEGLSASSVPVSFLGRDWYMLG